MEGWRALYLKEAGAAGVDFSFLDQTWQFVLGQPFSTWLTLLRKRLHTHTPTAPPKDSSDSWSVINPLKLLVLTLTVTW